MKYYEVIRQNLVFYLKTSRFYYPEFISYHFFEFEYQVFEYLKNFNILLAKFNDFIHYFKRCFRDLLMQGSLTSLFKVKENP